MQTTPTWMSNAVKVGISYPEAFWKKKGLSGTIIGQIEPVIDYTIIVMQLKMNII